MRITAKQPKPALHQITFDGAMLARGFWLYVWQITTKDGGKVHYVGRTGDSSSVNAQSPFARLSQHLGRNRRSNALRRNLERRKLTAEECRSFRLVAYGPVFAESQGAGRHRQSRDAVAALENALANAMREAGYEMLNKVQCRKSLDRVLWRKVMTSFRKPFPDLRHRDSQGGV